MKLALGDRKWLSCDVTTTEVIQLRTCTRPHFAVAYSDKLQREGRVSASYYVCLHSINMSCYSRRSKYSKIILACPGEAIAYSCRPPESATDRVSSCLAFSLSVLLAFLLNYGLVIMDLIMPSCWISSRIRPTDCLFVVGGLESVIYYC